MKKIQPRIIKNNEASESNLREFYKEVIMYGFIFCSYSFLHKTLMPQQFLIKIINNFILNYRQIFVLIIKYVQ